jgi:hypothetical protein
VTRALVCAAVIAGVCGHGGLARAEPAAQVDAVALLPLDTDPSLEIYGQPVASEIARALVAGDLAVVVVGPRMAVPERARLIIDGTIAVGKAGAVTISLRIRNTVDGLVLENLAATAPGLAKIDGAAAELSVRVPPIVRARLAALHRPSEDHGRVTQGPRPVAPARPVLIAVTDSRRTPSPDPGLAGALDAAAARFCHAHHREVRKVDVAVFDRKLAAPAVASLGADLAIGFWILGYTAEAEPGKPPMARARVRVQVRDASAVVFDRVVVTDTVLGDIGLAPAELAARAAREVLAILRPHMRRSVPSWQ